MHWEGIQVKCVAYLDYKLQNFLFVYQQMLGTWLTLVQVCIGLYRDASHVTQLDGP